MAKIRKQIEDLNRRAASILRNRVDNRIFKLVLPPGWSPKSLAQRLALESKADILLFGGAAGSLKTETILVDAIRECLNPNLRGVIFRSELTQLTDIVEKTHRLYRPLGASYSPTNWTWTFPSGATVRLAYISVDTDIYKYMGPRYSYIGFDESTFHTEFQIRNMLGRLSSTDPRLFLRMRLASNPGSIGAAFHKSMFLRNGCPVHSPKICAQPGQLYTDACWPSDQYPLCNASGRGFSVAFIPGRLTDHDLLDNKYPDRLRMMSGSLSAAMEQGCWCALDGAYFANWNVSKMVIPYPMIDVQWWDSHFISLDYGFGKSSASAHLHVRTRDGKIKTIGEFVAAHLPAYQFAQEVVRRFVLPLTQEERRRIVAVYLDPANFRDIGDGHTIANQINEVLEPYGLGVLEASNDRIGGWQLMYQMLQTGQWLIADTCPKLIEAIPSRMHDETRPGDVRKVPGDSLDDVSDSARYGIYSFITSSEKPKELIDREMFAEMAAQGQLTSCLIRWEQHHAVRPAQPVRIGRYRPRRTR